MKPRTLTTLVLSVLLAPLAVSVAVEGTIDGNADKQKLNKAGSPPAVSLTIDYGDGAQKRFPAVPWKDKMTVFDAISWSAKHPHGIQLKHRGRGSLAMVNQIDDLKNSGGSGKNWIFYVNRKLAIRGCGASTLAQGDEILWRFEVYR